MGDGGDYILYLSTGVDLGYESTSTVTGLRKSRG